MSNPSQSIERKIFSRIEAGKDHRTDPRTHTLVLQERNRDRLMRRCGAIKDSDPIKAAGILEHA